MAAFALHEEFDPYSERILEAARREIGRYGLRRTSLDDIAKTADVGRATLFRRFPNRDALLTALAMREARAAIAVVDAEVASLSDPAEILVTAAIAVLRQMTGNSLLGNLLVSDPEQILPLLTTRGAAVVAVGREYIAGHLRRLPSFGIPVDDDDIGFVAEVMARLTVSFVLNPVSVLPLDDEHRLEQLLRATVASLLRIPPESRP